MDGYISWILSSPLWHTWIEECVIWIEMHASLSTSALFIVRSNWTDVLRLNRFLLLIACLQYIKIRQIYRHIWNRSNFLPTMPQTDLHFLSLINVKILIRFNTSSETSKFKNILIPKHLKIKQTVCVTHVNIIALNY